MSDTILLKLGGSLITQKNQPGTPRREVLARLAIEIADFRSIHPHIPLIIGHGSGSFGHTAAKKHGTRQGVDSPEGWIGFAEVWKEARTLNQIVLEALLAASLPVIAFPPSAFLTARDGQIEQWNLTPLQSALAARLIPLVNGDAVFDLQRGGTILSTEDVFTWLARKLNPQRILLAGIDEGVWSDFPACTQLIEQITPSTYERVAEHISGSANVDVTGGMLEKVKCMLNLVNEIPAFQSFIFSGLQPGNVRAALEGEIKGTCICADPQPF